MQVDHVTIKGETTDIVLEPITIKDSSLESPSQKKKPRNTCVGARKVSPSHKVAITPKTKKERKAYAGKGEKVTDMARKLVSTESANSSPDLPLDQ